jgi:hypothetical protein
MQLLPPGVVLAPLHNDQASPLQRLTLRPNVVRFITRACARRAYRTHPSQSRVPANQTA